MKTFATIALTGLCVILLMSSAYSQNMMVDADTILAVSRAAHAPVIDAVMDTIWLNVPQQEMTRVVGGETLWDDWYDNAVAYRVMYDDTYWYIWCNYIDEELVHDTATETNVGDNWQDDSFEWYFDADLSQGDAYDGVDDIQCRYGWDFQIGYGWGTTGGDRSADFEEWLAEQVDTDLGWDAEIAVPLVDIQLDPEPGWILGWEFDGNDDDGASAGNRDTKLKWHSHADNNWQYPRDNGTAELVARVADDILDVQKTNTAPVIDGAMDEVWKDVAAIHGNRILDYTKIDDFDDIGMDWRTMWDANNIYYFLQIRDDVLMNDGNNDHNDDGFELYFDPDYSHTAAWDGVNDVAIRYRYVEGTVISAAEQVGQVTAGIIDLSTVQAAGVVTDLGWDVEVAIPIAQLHMTPTAGHIYGVEVDYNDDDDGGDRDTKVKSYSLSDNTWQKADDMVKAMLKDDMPVGVAKDQVQEVFTYSLAQNYPNPFNPTTNIDFTVAKNAHVSLVVYNLLGEEVATLVDEVKPAGQHTVTFSGAELPSGVYFYTLDTGSRIFTQKMLLVK